MGLPAISKMISNVLFDQIVLIFGADDMSKKSSKKTPT